MRAEVESYAPLSFGGIEARAAIAELIAATGQERPVNIGAWRLGWMIASAEQPDMAGLEIVAVCGTSIGWVSRVVTGEVLPMSFEADGIAAWSRGQVVAADFESGCDFLWGMRPVWRQGAVAA